MLVFASLVGILVSLGGLAFAYWTTQNIMKEDEGTDRMKEIAAALLLKEETIKKRLMRARKKIRELDIALEYPDPGEIEARISGVLQIIYLIFNEGFQSTKKDHLIDKELCGEALRLCKLLLLKARFRSGRLYA